MLPRPVILQQTEGSKTT